MASKKEGQVPVRLLLDPETAALLLKLSGGARSQSRYVTGLIHAAAAGQLPYLDLTERVRLFEQQVTQQLAELKAEVNRATIAATHARLIPDEAAPPYDPTG